MRLEEFSDVFWKIVVFWSNFWANFKEVCQKSIGMRDGNFKNGIIPDFQISRQDFGKIQKSNFVELPETSGNAI